jgi:FMN-binding domain
MIERRRLIAGAVGAWLVVPVRGSAQEGVFLRAEEAPRHLFPDATDVTAHVVPSTADLRRRIRTLMGSPPTLWETEYPVFSVTRPGGDSGVVIVVEEIGKHRPITFAVAITPDAKVHDLAVLSYREAYGGDIRQRRFLKQYAGKSLESPLQPYRDIQNISGATLSVQATGRAARKAIAVLKAAGELA